MLTNGQLVETLLLILRGAMPDFFRVEVTCIIVRQQSLWLPHLGDLHGSTSSWPMSVLRRLVRVSALEMHRPRSK